MTNAFKVGDKVEIVRKVTERSIDFQNSWVPSMDDYIGKIFTVKSICYDGIEFYETHFMFPPKSLVKTGFSSNQEAVNYMRRGGYVVVELPYGIILTYRIKNGILECNSVGLSWPWKRSSYSIELFLETTYNLLVKRKYYDYS